MVRNNKRIARAAVLESTRSKQSRYSFLWPGCLISLHLFVREVRIFHVCIFNLTLSLGRTPTSYCLGFFAGCLGYVLRVFLLPAFFSFFQWLVVLWSSVPRRFMLRDNKASPKKCSFCPILQTFSVVLSSGWLASYAEVCINKFTSGTWYIRICN